MRQYNEKPCKFQNLGSDIDGAHRHNNDTYETPEELRAKAFKKQSDKSLKDLKAEYIKKFETSLNESTELARECLYEYEFKKCLLSTDLLSEFKGTTRQELRQYVIDYNGDYETKKLLRKKFNTLAGVIYKIQYRIRPIELYKYFETKQKNNFKEINGHQIAWKTAAKDYDQDFLKSNIMALQFGNSLSVNERIYVSENLIIAIKNLRQYFNIDFSKLGFSYGARGRAGSIAHYQDSKKVLAFNRGWDGALIHELGHAVDYSLNLVSRDMPYSIRANYREKLKQHPILKTQLDYYMKPTEIFARMFEAYCKLKMKPEHLTSYMIFLNSGDASLPDLNQETIEWFETAIKNIILTK